MWIGIGLRFEQLDWNIADTDGSPDVLSELTWDKLISVAAQGRVSTVLSDRVHIQLDGQLGVILSGDNQDSDYGADNRQDEFSRSNNDGGEGNVGDLSASIGWVLIKNDLHTLVPQVGYGFSVQQLTIQDGNQTINTGNPSAVGPIPGLNSSYDTLWHGPWLGLQWQLGSTHSNLWLLELRGYTHNEYVANANWNLRSDFQHPVSFRHEADAQGLALTVIWQNSTSNGKHYGIRFNWQRMATESGVDRVFFSDGTTQETKLNSANWQMFGAGFYMQF